MVGKPFKKEMIPWNKGTKGVMVAWNKGKVHSEETKLKISKNRKGKAPWNKGIKTSIVPKTAFKKGHISWAKSVAGTGILKSWNKGQKIPNISGENHFAWKGEEVSYRSLHKWIERKMGKPHVCEECRKDSLRHRQYHWSNVSGNYKRLISDWRRLCAKCHKAFDAHRAVSLMQ